MMPNAHHTKFPVLDAPRDDANAELGRVVVDSFGYLEPHLPELDWWCALPVRLVHDAAGGWHLEVGPYSLTEIDIERLRVALCGYDAATGRSAR